MRFLSHLLMGVMLTTFIFAAGGCASSRKKVERDPALVILSAAAIQVHEEMMTTSSLMHVGKARTYEQLLPKDYDLMVPIEFKWVGPAWPALSAIAERINYRPRLQGVRPSVDPVITLATTQGATVYDLLNDLNIQIRESKGQVLVDSINCELILNYRK